MKKSSSKGNILIVALIMIVVISGFVGVAFNATNNASRLADRSRDHVVEQAAVEGAVEYAYGVWKKRLVQNPALLGSNFNTGLTSPNFSGLTYASNLRIDPLDQYGAIAGAPTAVLTDLPQFKGWRGQTFNYMARAKILRNGSPSDYAFGIRRQFGYSQVPLFQAMYFFEHNIEIYRPAPIIVSGLVHTNADAYLSGSNAGSLVFEGNVSYAGTYSESADPPFAYTWSGYSPNSQIPPTRPNGQPVVAEKVPRMEPLGIEPEAVIDATDVNPNNDSMRELIEPPNTDYTDKDEISSRRLYNKAGLLINIDGSTITVTGQNGLAVSSATETAIRNTISAKATIYDQRDGRNVEVSSVDIGALRTALSTGAGGFNNVLYIHDTTPLTNTNNMPKAIRLQNGGILPDNGLTVASENPIYIKGDYNTGTTSDPLQVPANAIQLRPAAAAVDLHGPVGRIPGRIRGKELGFGHAEVGMGVKLRIAQRRVARGFRDRGPFDQRIAAGTVHLDHRDVFLHQLMLAD